MIHVEAIAYFSATFNPQDQDTTVRDEHLPSSDGVCEKNHDIKHRIHISERVMRVNISAALLAPASYAAVLADARPAALLAPAPYAVVLTVGDGGVCPHSLPGGRSEVYTFL